MIKIYGMSTCIDCTNLNYLVKNNNKYEVIDIGLHVKDLKAFLNLRDNHAVFDQAKKTGSIGIPCFVLEDTISESRSRRCWNIPLIHSRQDKV